MYEGYKRLMRNQKFTETEEQKVLLEEFLCNVDPIIDFINSNDFSNRTIIWNKEAFKEFKNWANESNVNHDYTQRSFSRNFKKAFLERNPEWDTVRTDKDRGVKRRE